MVDKNLLKSKMALYGDTQNTLAEFLGISIQRLSAKMNSRQIRSNVKAAQFTQNEMYLIMKRYKLTPEEFVQIFFPDPEPDPLKGFMNPPEA